jgi:hypothetical protein
MVVVLKKKFKVFYVIFLQSKQTQCLKLVLYGIPARFLLHVSPSLCLQHAHVLTEFAMVKVLHFVFPMCTCVELVGIQVILQATTG